MKGILLYGLGASQEILLHLLGATSKVAVKFLSLVNYQYLVDSYLDYC